MLGDEEAPEEGAMGPWAGDVYARVIDELLQQERDRKASLEQRALAVITSAGVLVTLVLGFSAFGSARQATTISVPARVLLLAALLALLAAAVASLRINQPVDYSPLGVNKDLRMMLTDELWEDTSVVARRAIAEFRVGEIDRWREENGRKARRLQIAFIAESTGVALLVASVGVLLFHDYPA